MKVGLYFGSFNPIHHGHLIIAQHVVQNSELDQVWFVVSPQNPLKPSSGLLNEFHRLYLIQLSIEETQHLKVTDIEFRLPRPSYTVDTLTYLNEKYPQHKFAVIMGSDSFENLPRWKNYQHILSNYKVFVYKRPGHEVNNTFESTRIEVLSAPLLEISATHIRNTIKAGKSIRYLVPDKVAAEIERNGYYKT